MSKPLPVPMFKDDRAEWFDAAHKAMDALIARGRVFTADDFRDLVPMPANPNWVGNVFNTYKAWGYISQDGFDIARSRSRRGGVLRRWRVVDASRG